MTDQDGRGAWKTFTEEVEVTGNQLVAQITKFLAEGNVRTIKVRSQNSDVHFDIPMTAGLVTGGIVALTAPWLVVLGAVAGMVAKLKIEIVRQEPTDDFTELKSEMPESATSDGALSAASR